jgi:hypothetical protein
MKNRFLIILLKIFENFKKLFLEFQVKNVIFINLLMEELRNNKFIFI